MHAPELLPRTHAHMRIADLTIARNPQVPLVDRSWELLHNLTTYEAAFPTLGEVLDTPLITCDSGLAGSTHSAQSEVYGT